MKRQDTHHLPAKGMIGTAVATATILGCSVVPFAAQAAPRPDVVTSGIYVNILTPQSVTTDGSKQLEISAFYQAADSTGGVTTFQLFVDGQQQAIQNLATPDMRGVVSFRISPGTLTPGSHHFVITVSAADAEVASAKTDLTIEQPLDDSSSTSSNGLSGSTVGSAPSVAITSPLPQATVVGIVDIKVDAHDASGNPPYVSLFIDHSFKTLRNYPPFDFAWDTTRVQNGLHTIEVWGYNDDQAVGHAQPLTVLVDNPSGRTTVRHDLLDTVPQKVLIRALDVATTPKPAAVHPVAAVPTPKQLALDKSQLAVKNIRLASATATEVGEAPLPAQTLLMAPFLSERPAPAAMVQQSVPVVERPAAAVQRPVAVVQQPTAPIALPTLSEGRPASIAVSDERTFASSADSTTFSADESLTAPQISERIIAKPIVAAPVAETPVAQVPVVASPIAKIVPSLRSTIQSVRTVRLASANIEGSSSSSSDLEAPDITYAPPSIEDVKKLVVPAATPAPKLTMAKLATGQSVSGEADLASTEIHSSDLYTPAAALQAPVISLRQLPAVHVEAQGVSTRAILAATQIDQNHDTFGATRMVSASVGSATLFTASETLQTPSVTLKSVVHAASVATGRSHIYVLGQSNTGFPLRRVLLASHGNQVVMNNQLISLQQPLQDRSSFLYAPFRQIFESEGGVLAWNGDLHQVHALSSTRDILLTIGSKTAVVNQQPFALSSSPYITCGHTMIPLSFVPIALNAKVSFDPASGHLMINSNN